MTRMLASYVLALEQSSRATVRAEDRPIYQQLLADAASLLAAAVAGEELESILARISTHDRLWGHTWLQDSAYKPASDAWEAAKAFCRARIA